MIAITRLLASLAAVWLVASWAPAAAAGNGLATSAWRCGVDGRVYSDTPCTGGREIGLPAPRPDADVRAAERVAQREAALADRLKREREARAAAALAANALPVSLGPARRAEVQKHPTRPGRMERKGPGSHQRPPEAAQAAAPKLTRPRKPHPSLGPAFDRDAAERTWQATVPSSPRMPG